jgi:hypothetical protein
MRDDVPPRPLTTTPFAYLPAAGDYICTTCGLHGPYRQNEARTILERITRVTRRLFQS